jgi:hypothetical protein
MDAPRNPGSKPLTLSVDWLTFTERLCSVLQEMREDQFLIISDKHSHRFVQFAAQGGYGMRAEAVSNRYLPRPERLNPRQRCDLLGIGWKAPTTKSTTPARDPHGSPNFHAAFPVPVPFVAVAGLATRTLAEVFRVAHPGHLQYRSFDSAKRGDLSWPQLRLKAESPAVDPADIAQRLLATLREETGIDNLEFDEDGDIVLRSDTVSVLIDLQELPPTLRIRSALLRDIDATPSLLERLNELNATQGQPHFFVRDGIVGAATHLPVHPYEPAHVVRMLREFCQAVVATESQLKAGGDGSTYCSETVSTRTLH